MEDILVTPDKLRDLDLDAFAEELERQVCLSVCLSVTFPSFPSLSSLHRVCLSVTFLPFPGPSSLHRVCLSVCLSVCHICQPLFLALCVSVCLSVCLQPPPPIQDYGNKRTTLYDIRDELFAPYKERRNSYTPLSAEEKFTLLTGETPDSLYEGKLMTCTVVGTVRRKPSRDTLDRANPIKNERTGYWQCPFCLKSDFRDLSLVCDSMHSGNSYYPACTCAKRG